MQMTLTVRKCIYMCCVLSLSTPSKSDITFGFCALLCVIYVYLIIAKRKCYNAFLQCNVTSSACGSSMHKCKTFNILGRLIRFYQQISNYKLDFF